MGALPAWAVVAVLALLLGLAVVATGARALSRALRRLRSATAEADAARERAERLLACSAGTAILACDVDGTVQLANPGAVDAFGHPAADLVGRSVAFVVAPGELADQAAALGTTPDLRSVLAACARTPGARREWILRRADGEARVHAVAVAPMTGAAGRLVGFVVTTDDVTDRVRAEEARVLAYLAEHEAARRLREADGVKDTLVATVSHELRTPITNITGFTEMLAEGDFGELTAAQASAVQRITDNSRRLLALVDDLLALARLEAGLVSPETRLLDLRVVVEEAAAASRTALRGRGPAVRLDVGLASSWVEGDPEALREVVVALLDNAAKFTPGDDPVVVRLATAGDEVVLTVADRGLGIPADEVARVTERFFRARNAWDRAVQGTGLGLAVVAAQVARHAGRVEVASVEGEGTTVAVVLPRAAGPTGTPAGRGDGPGAAGVPVAPDHPAYTAAAGDFEVPHAPRHRA
ncbi:ATP-binding protein [Nocardioides perillae]|uniref:histidine kinase n=1 Tax=Nocardioides perillae TaxID=1119534 RepID=A0A7Y9RXG8_9ACTN|nr:PAS domain S-box-containing protein [Nocardioides perillae]